MDGKVFKGSVGHQELAAWVDELETLRVSTNRNLAKECDCMKKKFFVVIAIIVVLVILLTPVRMNLKDGGSV